MTSKCVSECEGIDGLFREISLADIFDHCDAFIDVYRVGLIAELSLEQGAHTTAPTECMCLIVALAKGRSTLSCILI